jgi:hypothetical protein
MSLIDCWNYGIYCLSRRRPRDGFIDNDPTESYIVVLLIAFTLIRAPFRVARVHERTYTLTTRPPPYGGASPFRGGQLSAAVI